MPDSQENLSNMSSAGSKPIFLISVIGCPGAGKGTLCRKLAAEYDGSHQSVGDLLRATIQDEESPESRELTPYIRSGSLVPTEILLKVLRRSIAQNIRENPLFLLIDGFPRDLQQGIEFETEIGRPDLVLFLSCDKEIAKQRFQTRKLPGRLDDDVEMFERRYREYELLNREIVEHYQAMGTLVQINSNGDTSTSYRKLVQTLSEREEWKGLLAMLEKS